MPLYEIASHRPSVRAYYERNRIRSYRGRRRSDVLPTNVPFHRWTLGFRQYRFSRIAQALQGHAIHIFRHSPLYSRVDGQRTA